MKILGLSPNNKHEETLRMIGEFCQADSIEYQDHGKGETYIIMRGSKVLRLNISGNAMDGGYLNATEHTL